jgi:hypothetical protein
MVAKERWRELSKEERTELREKGRERGVHRSEEKVAVPLEREKPGG